MNPDDVEAVLSETARVIGIESAAIEVEKIFRRTLPAMLGEVLAAYLDQLGVLEQRIQELEQHRGH